MLVGSGRGVGRGGASRLPAGVPMNDGSIRSRGRRGQVGIGPAQGPGMAELTPSSCKGWRG
jgi:hypothetical protein